MKPPSHSIEDRLQALQRTSILQRLPIEELRLLAETMGMLHLDAGEVLFHQGDPGYEAFVVLEGELVGTLGDVNGVERARFLPGDFFGKYALFKEHRRTLTVSAKQECVLMVLPHERFEPLLLVRPEISLLLLHELVSKLAELEQRLLDSKP